MVEDRGPKLRVVCLIFAAIAFGATILRVFVRLRIVRSFGWDDAWMVAAMLTHIMFATCAVISVQYGTGRQYKDIISEEYLLNALRYWWLCYMAYILTMIAAKMSISLFFLRITIDQLQRRIIYVAMGLSSITGVVFLFVTIFQCNPTLFSMDHGQSTKCMPVNIVIGLTYFYSSVNVLCDLAFGLMPFWIVWGLKVKQSEKLVLVPILSMGCLASIAVIVRMAFVMEFRSAEFLYDTVNIAIWSDIEQGLAITAASLATLRPLYRIVMTRIESSETLTASSNESREEPYLTTRLGGIQNNKMMNGQLSSISCARNDSTVEEYELENCRPVMLADDLVREVDEEEEPTSQANFASWKTQLD